MKKRIHNNRKFSLLIVLCIVLGLAQPSVAKCIIKTYYVIGKVGYKECCDCKDCKPISDAKVMVFFDGDEAYGETGITLNDGSFEIESHYSTYSGPGFFVADKCGRTPSSITVVVDSKGYYPIMKKIEVRKPERKDDKLYFEVPQIILTKKDTVVTEHGKPDKQQ